VTEDRRPTIAHVLHRLYLAGAEVLAADLARRLVDRYRCVFVCLDEVGPLGRSLRDEGFVVESLGRKPGIDMQAARAMSSFLEQHRVDLIHAHQYTPFFYASVGRGKLPWFNCGMGLRSQPPILFTEHGRHFPDHRRIKRVLANQLLLKNDDHVTAVGDFVKQMLIANEGIAAGHIEVIFNGVDPAEFARPSEADAARAEARAKLGLAPTDRVVMQVARFHPVKDHATAIRGFAHALEILKRDEHRPHDSGQPLLLLIGDGPEQNAMIDLAKQLGIEKQTRFVGVRDDVAKLLPAADVFCLSSLSEGISVTLLEAMATRLPIVATRVGGNPEVVDHGKTGLLSPRSDHTGFGQHLALLLGDAQQRQRMGEAGQDRLQEHFTQQQMHERYEETYQRMLGRSS